MAMTPEYLADKFTSALPYSQYLRTGTEEQQRRWTQVYEAARLSDSQRQLLGGFVREMKVLVVSGIWCGDCVQQCPFLEKIAEANFAKVSVRFVDRDQHRDLAEQVRINQGDRVPVALFLAEDFHLCAVYGDRSLSRYRALASRQLGASCPIGITAPPASEIDATLGDWLGEVERVQLMLRLSSRLRAKHAD